MQRSEKPRRNRLFLKVAKFSASEPLMVLLGLGFAYGFTPPEVLSSVAYQRLFAVVPQAGWSISCFAFASIGYYGLYSDDRRAWLISHGGALAVFVSMAVYFGLAGSISGTTTYLALAVSSWIRYIGLHKNIDL